MAVNVDNEIYRRLGERWYFANDDPVALLRAEARLHAGWIAAGQDHDRTGPLRILDVGCGGGFFAHELVERDAAFEIVGVDRAAEAVAIARAHDTTGRTRFVVGDARSLPFPDASFDVVCALDVLEHVEPGPVVAEAARVLRPGGSFYFHTFNRTWLARLVVVHAVELFVRNVPPHLHDHRAFVRPDELEALCSASGLSVRELRGSRPELSTSLLRLGLTGVVPPDLRFRYTSSLAIGYAGRAERVVSA